MNSRAILQRAFADREPLPAAGEVREDRARAALSAARNFRSVKAYAHARWNEPRLEDSESNPRWDSCFQGWMNLGWRTVIATCRRIHAIREQKSAQRDFVGQNYACSPGAVKSWKAMTTVPCARCLFLTAMTYRSSMNFPHVK
jgi:hypothetical protein